MYITEHAKERIKKRNGANKKSLDRIARKAYENGIRHCETKGRLHQWVTEVYFRTEKANNIRLYGDKAYLFHGDMLLTVLQIPSNLTKDMRKMIKREIHTTKE